MTSKQTDYLKFSANSMSEYLRQKLLEDGTFTDSIFADSNLSVILEVFSYMYSMLIFYLNNSAAESIFTDAQLYENMNRIVKMLGYNPVGFISSNVVCTMGVKSGESLVSGTKVIPKYTTLSTSLIDSSGNTVKYSFVDDYKFTVPVTGSGTSSEISSIFKPVLYNGEWKFYDSVPVSTGIPFEVFTLLNLNTTGNSRIYLAHNQIYVYVEDATGTFTEYKPTNNLYNFGSNDKYFEVRINENYQYTLKFGDNINGKRLTAGDKLYIIYLQSNGVDGEIGANILNSDIIPTVAIVGLDESFIRSNILKINENPQYITFGSDSNPELAKLTLTNNTASTYCKDFETTDDIRTNAPNWFRIGSRLITNQDFEQYIKTTWPAEVHDVKCMNNWEYMVEFQQWLRSYNKLNIDIRHYDYQYSDSCDFNNIYIFMKSKTNDNLSNDFKRIVENNYLNQLKVITSEIVMSDPLLVTFTPWLGGTYDIFNWDINHENKIVLVRDRNTMITVERIKQRAIQIIQDFFSIKNNKLGQNVDINSLYNQLSAIDGVKEVKTSYCPYGSPANMTQYYDGLSFAKWTQHIILGEDKTKISGNFKLKSFQFPILFNSTTISNKISVAADSLQISEIEY